MEHEGRIEGGDARESGEGAEEERGASSDEREAVVGSEREVSGLTGGIKKKKPHTNRGIARDLPRSSKEHRPGWISWFRAPRDVKGPL